jgi:hypothetical protein
MNFPAETTLRLCRKALVESRRDFNEARVQARRHDADIVQAVERLSASLGDLLVNIDYRIDLLARRRA